MTTLDPDKVGFPEGIPGHKLGPSGVVKQQYGQDIHKFACACGWEVSGYLTQSGKISQFCITSYRNHLEASVADPTEEHYIGKVTKQRIEWVVKVIHADHPVASEAADHSTSRNYYKSWVNPPKGSWMAQYRWGLLVERFSRKGTKLKVPMKLEGLYRTREQAILQARHFISKEEERGATVEYSNLVGAPQAMPTFGGTLSTMLEMAEEAAASRDLGEVTTALDELDRVMSLVHVIEARRDELAAIKEERTTALLK